MSWTKTAALSLQRTGPGGYMYGFTGVWKPVAENQSNEQWFNLMDDGIPIGSIWFSPPGEFSPTATHIYQLYIQPEYRNLEAFQTLLQPVIDLGAPIQAAFDNLQLSRVVRKLVDRGSISVDPRIWHMNQTKPEWGYLQDDYEQQFVSSVHDELVEQVRESLSDDLLKPGYGGEHPMIGHCYIASEALYHMLGGKESGYHPVRLRLPDGIVHWWLENDQGEVIDATHDQFQGEPVPYEQGKAGGFLTAEPSKRAQELMRRVGAEQLPLWEEPIRPPKSGELAYHWDGSLNNPRDALETLNAYDGNKIIGTVSFTLGNTRGYTHPEIKEIFVLPEYRKTPVFFRLLEAAKEMIGDRPMNDPFFINDRLEELWQRWDDRSKTAAGEAVIREIFPGATYISYNGEMIPFMPSYVMDNERRVFNAYRTPEDADLNENIIGSVVVGCRYSPSIGQMTTIDELYVDKAYRGSPVFMQLVSQAREAMDEYVQEQGAHVAMPDFQNERLEQLWDKHHERFLSKTAGAMVGTHTILSPDGTVYLEYRIKPMRDPDSYGVEEGPYLKPTEEAQEIVYVDAFGIRRDNLDSMSLSLRDPRYQELIDTTDWHQVASVLSQLRDLDMPVYGNIVNRRLREFAERFRTAQFIDAQGQEIERGDTLVYIDKDPNPDPTSNSFGVQKVLHIDPAGYMVLKWHDGHRDEWFDGDSFIKVSHFEPDSDTL